MHVGHGSEILFLQFTIQTVQSLYALVVIAHISLDEYIAKKRQLKPLNKVHPVMI